MGDLDPYLMHDSLVFNPNGISIVSAVLEGLRIVTDRPTD